MGLRDRLLEEYGTVDLATAEDDTTVDAPVAPAPTTMRERLLAQQDIVKSTPSPAHIEATTPAPQPKSWLSSEIDSLINNPLPYGKVGDVLGDIPGFLAGKHGSGADMWASIGRVGTNWWNQTNEANALALETIRHKISRGLGLYGENPPSARAMAEDSQSVSLWRDRVAASEPQNLGEEYADAIIQVGPFLGKLGMSGKAISTIARWLPNATGKAAKVAPYVQEAAKWSLTGMDRGPAGMAEAGAMGAVFKGGEKALGPLDVARKTLGRFMLGSGATAVGATAQGQEFEFKDAAQGGFVFALLGAIGEGNKPKAMGIAKKGGYDKMEAKLLVEDLQMAKADVEATRAKLAGQGVKTKAGFARVNPETRMDEGFVVLDKPQHGPAPRPTSPKLLGPDGASLKRQYQEARGQTGELQARLDAEAKARAADTPPPEGPVKVVDRRGTPKEAPVVIGEKPVETKADVKPVTTPTRQKTIIADRIKADLAGKTRAQLVKRAKEAGVTFPWNASEKTIRAKLFEAEVGMAERAAEATAKADAETARKERMAEAARVARLDKVSISRGRTLKSLMNDLTTVVTGNTGELGVASKVPQNPKEYRAAVNRLKNDLMSVSEKARGNNMTLKRYLMSNGVSEKKASELAALHAGGITHYENAKSAADARAKGFPKKSTIEPPASRKGSPTMPLPKPAPKRTVPKVTSRGIRDIANDINTVVSRGSAQRGGKPLWGKPKQSEADARREARARLNKDLIKFRESARKKGRTLAEELREQKIDSEHAAALVRLDSGKTLDSPPETFSPVPTPPSSTPKYKPKKGGPVEKALDIVRGTILRHGTTDKKLFWSNKHRLKKAEAAIWEGEQSGKAVVKWAKGATEAERAAVDDYLNGRVGLESVPSKVRAEVEAMRGLVDGFTDRAIASLTYPDPPAADATPRQIAAYDTKVANIDRLKRTMEGNKGRYLRRTYDVHLDKKYEPGPEEYAGMRDYLRGKAEASPEFETGPNKGKKRSRLYRNILEMTDAELDGYLHRDWLVSTRNRQGGTGTGTSPTVKQGAYKKRGDIPEPIRKFWGERTDAKTRFDDTIEYLSRVVANQEFFIENRNYLSISAADAAKQGKDGKFSVQLPDSPSWGAMKGRYVTPEVAEFINQQMSPDSLRPWSVPWGMQKVFRGVHTVVTSPFKAAHTFLNVPTHARNLQGNPVFTAYAENFAGNPANWGFYKDGARLVLDGLMSGTKKLNKTIEVNTAQGKKTMSFRKLWSQMIEDRIVDTEFYGSEVGKKKQNLATPTDKPAKARIKQIAKMLGVPYRSAARLYNVEDQWFKVATYLKHLPKGREYAKNQVDYFPNYEDVPLVTKVGREIPFAGVFVSFKSEAVRSTHKYAAEGVKKAKAGDKAGATRHAAILSAVLGGVATLNKTLMDIHNIDEDELKKVIANGPEYRRNSQYLAWRGKYPWIPSQDGEIQIYDIGYVHPLGDPMQAAKSVTSGDMTYVNSVLLEHPGIDMINMLKQGKDKWGTNVWVPGDGKSQKIMDYTTAVLNSVYVTPSSPLPKPFKGYQWQKIERAWRDQPHPHTGEPMDLGEELKAFFLGFRLRDLDVEKTRRGALYRLDRRKRAIDDALKEDERKAGIGTSIVDQNAVNKAWDTYFERMDKVWVKMDEILGMEEP